MIINNYLYRDRKIVVMICFFFSFFNSTKSKNQWSCPLQTRESLKRPYFPLPLSILAGTNLIMLLFSFFAAPVWFPRKSIPHSISGKIHPRLISEKIHAKPQGKQKKKIPFFFVPCVFWICSRGRFAFMPLDLNFTNPKCTIFESGWKNTTFAYKSWSDYQITSYVLHSRSRSPWVLGGRWFGWEHEQIDALFFILQERCLFLFLSRCLGTSFSFCFCSGFVVFVSSGMISEDSVNQVDQFLREALQNPRERLSSELPRSRFCFSRVQLKNLCWRLIFW